MIQIVLYVDEYDVVLSMFLWRDNDLWVVVGGDMLESRKGLKHGGTGRAGHKERAISRRQAGMASWKPSVTAREHDHGVCVLRASTHEHNRAVAKT